MKVVYVTYVAYKHSKKQSLLLSKIDEQCNNIEKLCQKIECNKR